jgi:predicted Rossmann fold nucleotide-binding protein DprA/Smf involved in DNA uptake
MKNINEIPYWLALNHHLPRWGTEKTNRLIVKILHEKQMELETFFTLRENDWQAIFSLTEKEIVDIQLAKKELPNLSFMAEDLLSQGFEVITLNSVEYSKTLKANLKTKYSPTILYVKGNKNIMQEKSIAIVGSRDADQISLDFTDNIAYNACQQYKVVVSGFAKGVDKQALDSAIKYKGQSIIVLPQGIMTFATGFKKYYKQLVEGNVLVLSTFFPKATWNTGLAMARNPIIYGLADEIYVAQSSDKGGTWEGVLDGLKKGRTIFVRVPNMMEKNANMLLLDKGAVPVDFRGNKIEKVDIAFGKKEVEKVEEPILNYNSNLENEIIDILKKQNLTSKQLLEQLSVNLSDKELEKKLKKIPVISTKGKGKLKYYYIKQDNLSLF